MSEKTGPQTISTITFGDQILAKSDGGSTWYTKARKMRKDPTIALVRALAMAPALAAGWTVESEENAPEGAKDFIEKHFKPQRLHLLKTALAGMLDYGWQPYEKVFELDADNKVYIKKFKPLLQDLTDINVAEKTGAFDGFENWPTTGITISLPLEFSLLFSNNVEGSDWYGQATMRNAEEAYDEWMTVNGASKKYDKKIAGSHWVIHYPLGTSDYNGRTEVPNDEIAKDILQSLEASGAIALPRKVQAISEDLNDQSPDAWLIEILSDPGSSRTSFIDRQKYLDALKARAFELPERSVIEGEFGTKAEAEAHANFAITNIELRHQMMTEIINWHAVNQVLRFNWGQEFENTVRIQPKPLSDPARAFLKEVYRVVIGNPDGFLNEMDSIDLDSLKDKIGIPIIPESERTANELFRTVEDELRETETEDEDELTEE